MDNSIAWRAGALADKHRHQAPYQRSARAMALRIAHHRAARQNALGASCARMVRGEIIGVRHRERIKSK
jgi:hypothetical protein